ncbi:MAG TPA: hypothetical protein VIG24_14535 [Acidimicrobiia bacterium]
MSEHDLSEQPSKVQELYRDQIALDLEEVLSFPQGRRVLLRLLERCGVYRSAFTGETEATSLRLGEQNIGLWLISQIETVDPTEYPRLLLEAAQKQDKETVNVLDVDE